jgi:cytochrome c peroxidase
MGKLGGLRRQHAVWLAMLTVSAIARADSSDFDRLRDIYDRGVEYTSRVEFPPRVGSAGDPVAGQRGFGLSADGKTIDPSEALFTGVSMIAGPVQGNGRVCATCHRPDSGLHLGLPPAPLSSRVLQDDPLFTGLAADTGPEPLGLQNFNELALLLHRPNRLNPLFAPDDPLRQVFVWRKTNRLINTVFTFGILNDGRMRELVETTRNAVFTHTQDGDLRFDDLVDPQRLRDMSAFMESQIDPPGLADLLDPSAARYGELVRDPFLTVETTTALQKQGQSVFEKSCMTCHNMPNVFSNRDHVDGPPDNRAPLYGHTFDIGVAERNALKLEFRRFDPATGTRTPIVLHLATQQGTAVDLTVVDDIGAAAATARYEDLHRFKVPQLRRISELGPYFHDNSAATLEEVVDYFNGEDYNQSVDGRRYPVHLDHAERKALLAFLHVL